MAIHIHEITVKDLGPLSEFHMELGMVNLVYGRNELGKTHLVEFIIRSLFKKPGFDYLRSPSCRGEILITGIGDTPIRFTSLPKSKKLEDYVTIGGGLPPNLARLLVVRAGELAFARDEVDGTNRAILKEYLSNEGFLDKIQEHITKTIQNAQLGEAGEIIGKSAGEIKTRDDLRGRLKILDGLSARLQENYSDGTRSILKAEIEDARRCFDLQEKARRYRAWQLSGEIQRFEIDLGRLPKGILEKIDTDMYQFNEKSEKLAEKTQLKQEKESISTHYNWLVEAIDVYKSSGSEPVEHPGIGLLILAGAGLIAAIICSFLQFPAGTLMSVILASGLGWLYLGKTKKMLAHAADLKERSSILDEYSDRFGEKCNGLPGLEVMRKKLEPEFVAVKLLEDDIQKEIPQLTHLKETIQAQIAQLTGQVTESSTWGELLSRWKARITEMESSCRLEQQELDRLSVPSVDYLSLDPGIVFDPAEHVRWRQTIIELEEKLRRETESLADLKAEICRQTGDPLSIEWEDLIIKLKSKRSEYAQQYRALTAEITAGIIVNNALETFRLQEDSHILEGLQSPLVSEPLQRFTQRYNQLDIIDGKIQVRDAFSLYPLADLSTGAQEQVLLAMRVGFARKLMDKGALFLILDDAFQHSDWLRRENLVDEMVGLAQQGWQILYFSMDDHIRELFEKRVKPVLGANYFYKELIPNGH